ncbi:MAG TPA: hypothetical protein VGW38_03775, partial [Chloroflexota bacterium]|nr:hypothetical protein [Chloroflexota bacterium]
ATFPINTGTGLTAVSLGIGVRRQFAPGGQRVVGLLTSVQQRDIGHVESFTLLSADRQELRFVVAEGFNQTPGHLREHMMYGEAVAVQYRQTGDTLVATRADDADHAR